MSTSLSVGRAPLKFHFWDYMPVDAGGLHSLLCTCQVQQTALRHVLLPLLYASTGPFSPCSDATISQVAQPKVLSSTCKLAVCCSAYFMALHFSISPFWRDNTISMKNRYPVLKTERCVTVKVQLPLRYAIVSFDSMTTCLLHTNFPTSTAAPDKQHLRWSPHPREKKIFAMPACVVVWLTARLDWLPFKVIGSYFI